MGAPATAEMMYIRVQTTWSVHKRRNAALRDHIWSVVVSTARAMARNLPNMKLTFLGSSTN